MNHKALLGTAVAAALMFGAQAASACAISAWSSATGLTVADTGTYADGFSPIDGDCGLRVADSNGVNGRFVTDTTPNAETSFKARFYYFTGDIQGTAPIFQARNTGGTNIIQITHSAAGVLSFTANTGGAAQTVNVVDNRYYAIELSWTSGTPGTLTATVSGNAAAAVTIPVAGTVNFTTLSNSADRIDEVRLGLIGGSVTSAAPVYFDEYDSRRTTVPGLLCRGDAGGGPGGTPDFIIGAADRVLITNQILGTNQQPHGYRDANGDGLVASVDRVAVTNLILAGATCN